MSKRTVTTCIRRMLRAQGLPTPKAQPGERTEVEKAVSRAQRKPRTDKAPADVTPEVLAEAAVWAAAFGGVVEPVVATQPVQPVTAPKAPDGTITAIPARKAKAKPPVAVTAPAPVDGLGGLGTLEPGVTALIWHKLNRKPVAVTYAGRDRRGRLLIKGVGVPLTAIPEWLLTRAEA